MVSSLSRRRAVLASAAGVAAAATGFEAFSRRAAPRMMTSGAWFDNVVDFKARQLAHLERAGRLPTLVIAGHSMTFDACEPERVSRHLPPGESVYNAGVNLAPLALLRDWIRYVLEVARPPRLVIGLTTVDLNANGIEQKELLGRHLASVMGARKGEPDRAAPEFEKRWVSEVARNLPRAIRHMRQGRPIGLAKAQHLIGTDGRDFHKNGATYRLSPGFQERFRTKWLVDFRVGEEQVEAVRSMFAAAVESGCSTYLLIPPFTDDYVDLHPRGADDVASVIQAYYEVAESSGCGVLEAPRKMFSLADFADPIHLNDKGMARCSDWLGEQLSRGL